VPSRARRGSLVAVGLLAFSTGAFAAPKKRAVPAPIQPDLVDVPARAYRAGIEFGLGIPTTDRNGTSRPLVGADFYYNYDPSFDFGASYTTGGKQLETGRHSRTNFAGLEINYKLNRLSPGLYVGASAGIVSFEGGDAFLPGIDNLYVGPKVGFETWIARDFSLGLEGKILFVSAAPLFAWVDVLGSLRFHF
jgi:hypothetical protein